MMTCVAVVIGLILAVFAFQFYAAMLHAATQSDDPEPLYNPTFGERLQAWDNMLNHDKLDVQERIIGSAPFHPPNDSGQEWTRVPQRHARSGNIEYIRIIRKGKRK